MAKILKIVRSSSQCKWDLPDAVELVFSEDSLYTSWFKALYFSNVPFKVDMTIYDSGVHLSFYKSSEAE